MPIPNLPIPNFGQMNLLREQEFRANQMAQSQLKSQKLLQERTGIENQDLARAQANRQELEMLLQNTAPEEQDRAAYEWSRVKDPEFHYKLAALQIKKLNDMLGINPVQGIENYKRNTGEQVDLDPASGLVIKEFEDGRLILRPGSAPQFVKGPQADTNLTPTDLFYRDPAKYAQMLGTQAAFRPDQTRTDTNITPYEDLRSGDPARVASAVKFFEMQKANQQTAQGRPQIVTLYDNETGLPTTYWADPNKRTLTPAAPGGRTEARDIAQGTQTVLQGVATALPVIDELEKDLKQISTGVLPGVWATLSLDKLGGLGLGAKEVAVRTKMGRLTADQIFGEGGKALTATEKQMLGPYIINQRDNLQTALAKLPELRKRVNRIKASRVQMMNPRTRALHPELGGTEAVGTGGGDLSNMSWDELIQGMSK